ncbi:MAG: hypothetical protein IJR54_05820 [Oscillibacter sp.]|nr:hypothetical protein [Oscillibacter sp.]
MATEEMYDAAFRYRDSKLWTRILDRELFAFRFSDGEIGYCCAMGQSGERISLIVYVGEEGFQSYRELLFRDGDNAPLSLHDVDFSDTEQMLQQSFLECSFEAREALESWEVRQVRNYAKAHNFRLHGPCPWPKFAKYARYRAPWTIETPKDRRRICEALSAAVVLAGLLEGKSKRDLGLFPVDPETDTLPLLVCLPECYKVTRTDVPPVWEEPYPEPAGLERERVPELLALKKRGVYDCELLRLPGLLPTQTDAKAAPYFPVLLVCADLKTGYLKATNPVTDYDTHPEALRDAFVHALLESGECPRAVRLRDERTRALLEDLCLNARILFSVEANLPALDEARTQIWDLMFQDGDDIWDEDEEDDDAMDINEALSAAVEELTNMSDKELRNLPPAMVRQILEMANMGFIPQELQLRLRRLFKKI